MLRHSIAVLAGAFLACGFSSLPPVPIVVMVLVLAVAGLSLEKTRTIGSFLLGAGMFCLVATARTADKLNPELAGTVLTVSLQVIDFPVVNDKSTRLLVMPIGAPELPSRLRLGWYNAPPHVEAGQHWNLRIKLRRPRGNSNPGGFDYEGWLFREGIGATGYVVAHSGNVRLSRESNSLLLSIRLAAIARIDTLFGPGDARAVLKAITVGARNEISRSQWDVYARTGTSHLMAISGLHIGLAAGGAFLLAWAFGAVVCRRKNIRDISMAFAVVCALAYAAVSGFAVPAQRALLMAIIAGAGFLSRRRFDSGDVIAVTVLLVFIANPLVVLLPGFQLSFFAVIVLVWLARSAMTPEASQPRWHVRRLVHAVGQLTRLQFALLLGLFPLTVLSFGRVSLFAPLINLVVLPFFTAVTVPTALLGLVLDGYFAPLGDLLLGVSLRSIKWVLCGLSIAADIPMAASESALTGWSVLLVAGPAMLWVVLPAGWPGRGLALLAFGAALLHEPRSQKHGCLSADVLDVGQGLAVVMQTNTHTLLYDTGPAFRSGGNAAEFTIIPFLRYRGISRLDALVVSHSDLDHAGGVASILEHFQPGRILAGEPGATPGQRCESPDQWTWDDVSFAVIHPEQGSIWRGNNASCVILITIGEHKLLITGDIEAAAERSILQKGSIGPADIVIVPHHGSRTSSRPAFVNELHPSAAIVASGYGNRWGFPKPDVTARWQTAGAAVLTTADSGALSFQLCAGEALGTVREHRRDAKRIWHD